MSGNSHDYEAKHGTQAEQAARQASAGTIEVDGPWRLERWQATDGKTPAHVVLPNSVRSTYSEAKRLHDDEFARTDIRWGIARFPE